MSEQASETTRFYELLADEQLSQLTPEDRAQLEMLRIKLHLEEPNTLGEVLVMLDQTTQNQSQGEGLPDDLCDAICTTGHALVGNGQRKTSQSGVIGEIKPQASDRKWKMSAAAAIVIAGVSVGMLFNAASNHSQAQLALQTQLDEATAEQSDIAERLALVMENLESANETIAMYETPADPTELLAQRRELLSAPDTIRIAWVPFDQPGSLAEQQGVEGDVVWNDELEEGYLRFVGLEVNDPQVEQYQVWVIDDRGLEQRVSGGIFNASADGEVVVPIHPGIDMGRVALFAITIEKPGGTWVSDLQRRVVVAPRTDS
jgi:anti-sigma-K factor RskA